MRRSGLGSRAPARQVPALPLLCPPDVFGIVHPGVYRSNTFRSESYSFVKTLRLNTVVSFRAVDAHNKKEADQLSQFLEAGEVQQIVLRSMQGEGSAFSHCAAEETVKRVLEIILDVSKHPVLVMCSTGVHDTGMVLGCLRRLQSWSLTAVIDENRNFAASASVKTRHMNEVFVEMFDADLITLPVEVPRWLAMAGGGGGAGGSSYQEYTNGPLLSADCTFSVKKSICEEDDD